MADIVHWIILCHKELSYVLYAILQQPYLYPYMLVALPQLYQPKCLQTSLNILWEQNRSWLRTTALKDDVLVAIS